MSKKQKPTDTELKTQTVRQTNDFSKFKTLGGNRQVNQQHVNQLIRLMTQNGNLTDQFPIVISKDGYVIDGQHRLEALRILGWEVGYVVEENANIDTVRNINRGNRNWNWRDVAESYANLGNDEYEWFLHYFDTHNMSYTLAMLFCSAKQTKHHAGTGRIFSAGDFKVADKAQAELFANQYQDLREITDISTHDFGKALNKLFRSPYYNHERMVAKMKAQGHTLPDKANETDYRREIEAVFNYGFPDASKLRLF